MRTLCVLFSYIIAVSVPKFGLFVNLIGALSGTVLSFVMPIMIYNKVFASEMSCKRKMLHIALILFGCVVGVIAAAISIFDLIEAFKEKEVLNTDVYDE